VESDSDPAGGADGPPDVRPDPVASSTVGTGSMLGLGCVATVILLVVVALAIRWFSGVW
jgi:hypothetical protein